MSKEGTPLSLINSVGPNILKMDTSWGMLVMKLFKTIWCSRRKRAGRFNVHQANQKNLHGIERVPGFCRSTSVQPELFICNQSSELSGCCRSPVDRRPSPTGSIASTQSQSQLTPSRQLSDGERLKKVILELVDTERTYVKHLNSLLENYLEPLKNASFLSSAEVNALFGNIREIVAFQRLFLQALTEALDMEPAFHKFEHPYEFKNVLFSIGSAFLYYASQFKLYSSFCASHSKAQKVLHPSEGNQALQEFLASRNPRQQHSATLESYLIKPIQRILKYPLLLQQLKAITDPGSDEHRHLVEALKVMEKVAEHINEMQRIHEEYGAIFDHLFRQHQKSSKQVSTSSLQQPIDLSPGDLLYYGGVEWLNISDFLGKIKKGLELHAMCFVFKTAVVFLCKERLRQKKKLMGVPGKNSSSEVEIIRYQVLIPVTEVQVRASSMKDMDSHFLWELIHLKSQLQRRSEKVYHLSNSTSEFRNAFLKTIRQIIRESVRNMNIPANFSLKGSSQKPGSTNTLQPQRQAKKKQGAAAGHQSATLQRHSAGQIDYDNLESYDNVPETMQQQQQHHQQRGSIGTDSRSAAMSDGMDELSDSTTKSDSGMMVASATGADGGVDIMRSEGEDDEEEEEEEEEVLSSQRGGTHSASSVVVVKSGTLGRTPNHLSLSTTSTLSTGSTGSCARLIQASNQPAHYQPARSHAGSPVWKPRDSAFPSGGGSSGAGTSNSQTLPRSHKIATGREDHFHIYEEYGGNIYMSGGKKDQTEEKNQHDSASGRPPSSVKASGASERPPGCVACSKIVVLPPNHVRPRQTSSSSAKISTGGETSCFSSCTSNLSTARSSTCGVVSLTSNGTSPLSSTRSSTCGVPYLNSSNVEIATSPNDSLSPLSASSRCSHNTNVASIPYTSNCMGSHLAYSSKDRSPTGIIGAENSSHYPPSNVVRHRKPRTTQTSSLHINTSNLGSNSLQPSPNYSCTPGSSLQPSPNLSHTSSNEQANSCVPNAFSNSLQDSSNYSRTSHHHSKYLNTSSNNSTSSPASHISRTPYRSWQNSDLMDRTQDLMLDLNNALLNRAKHSSLNTNSSIGDYSNLSDSHSDISFSSSGFSNGQSSGLTPSDSRYKYQQKSRSLNEDLWLEGTGCYSPKSQRSIHVSGSNSHSKGNYSFPTSENGSSTDSLNGAAIGGAEGLAMTIDSLLEQLREIS